MPTAQVSLLAHLDPPSSGLVAGPSAEGVSDFLSVLRRRALPAELTDDKRKHFASVVSNCVTSLYRDRIRPVQNNVQRRLRERNCSEPIVQALLPICAREEETYRILPPSGSRLPVILLLQEPKWFEGFVDVEAVNGNYSGECWEALTSFLLDDNISLPSQPYQAALELRQMNLPHLQGLALGEMEHMVRLAMGRRNGLLAFHGDSLKPARVVRALEAREKQQRAKVDMEDAAKMKGKTTGPIGASSKVDMPKVPPPPDPTLESTGEIIDKDDLAVVLLQLMARFPEGVSLSNMKQHVQSHCQRNLNEASFKCSKLAEVFKLSPLSTIFPLEQVTNRNELIVKPPVKTAIPNHIWQKYYHLKEHGGLPPQSALPGQPPPPPLGLQ